MTRFAGLGDLSNDLFMRGTMKKTMYLVSSLLLFACGGSGSPTGSTPAPGPSEPPPAAPTVKDRSFTLSSLSIDSGASPLEIVPPQATGRLDMRANGAYTLTFIVAVANFTWSESITGTHTFAGNTLQMTPAAGEKTTVEPFRQTVIIDNISLTWQSDTQVVIPLPIRPGAWRSEDTILLTYRQVPEAAKPGLAMKRPSHGRFDYLALVNAFRQKNAPD